MNNIPVTENELKSKAVGRRVTMEDVNASIKSEHYFTAVDGVQNPTSVEAAVALGLMTFCVLVLQNGFSVTGQSACADPANYNQDLGQRIARENAVRQIWPLLGFSLKQDMHRDSELLGSRQVAAQDGFEVYIGTKVIHAKPMHRLYYNDLRGWEVPDDENPLDEGYIVEYTDGGQANVSGFDGYVSWSPKDVFEKSYKAVVDNPPGVANPKVETYLDRLKVEYSELKERLTKLDAFLREPQFNTLSRQDQDLMLSQGIYMGEYLLILEARLLRAGPIVPRKLS